MATTFAELGPTFGDWGATFGSEPARGSTGAHRHLGNSPIRPQRSGNGSLRYTLHITGHGEIVGTGTLLGLRCHGQIEAAGEQRGHLTRHFTATITGRGRFTCTRHLHAYGDASESPDDLELLALLFDDPRSSRLVGGTMTMTEPSTAERAKLEATRGLANVTRGYAVDGVELRAEEGAMTATFEGHASVTNRGYEMYGGPDAGGWTEFVDKGAFKRTLNANPDVPFLINHTGMTLARTKAGNLTLSEDGNGLKVRAELDTRVTIVNDLVLLMEAGNIDEMSFAFRVKKQRWLDQDGEEVPWWDMAGIERHLTEVDIHKGDVSVVNFGANPHTDAGLRSLDLVRSLTAEECEPGELRAAIDYLTSLLPAEPVAVHPDLVAAQHRAVVARATLRDF